MNELIMPPNVAVQNVLNSMKEVIAHKKKVEANYCQILNISPRTLQTLRDNGTLAFSQINHKVYYKPEDVKKILSVVEDKKKSQCMNLKRSAYERTDHAA